MSKKLIFWYGIKMENKNTILIGILLIGIVLISGCIKEIEKIPSQLCIEEGGRGYFGKDECCSGLTSLLRWTICDTPGDKRGCDGNGCFPPPPDGSFICTKCGDKICGLGENRCNCPKDCSEEIYPAEVKFTYFDDREKINNTAGFLIKLYEPIAKDMYGSQRVETLRNSGVRLLQASEISTVLHSLIEENKVEEVESLDFVEYVYPYQIMREPIKEPTKEMVEKIVLLENGKKEQIDINSEEGLGIASTLTRKLHELNLQSTCVFSKEDIREIEQKDRSIMLFFKKPIDITISQWVEPEERYHIPIDESGNRILENVEIALFILEDNQERGLEEHILVGHLIPPKMGSGHEKEWISYSCWAINIKQEGKPELDKTWIDELNKILISEEFCGWSTYAKCKTDVDCNMGGCSGEVCEGKGEGTITDCMWRDCYNVTGYECKCIDDKCQWSK